MLNDDEARWWVLNNIAAGESPDYVTRYTPDGGAKFNGLRDHPRVREVIPDGPNKGQTSDASGRYQFLSSTWDPIAAKLGLKDFSPSSQDSAAWWLAQDKYKGTTGRELLADAKAQKVDWAALAPTWPSLKRQKFAGTTSAPNVSVGNSLGGQGGLIAPTMSPELVSPTQQMLAALAPLLLLQQMMPQVKFTPIAYDPAAVAKKGAGSNG